MLKISGFYLYSTEVIQHLKWLKMAVASNVGYPYVVQCHNLSDIDLTELKFCTSSSYMLYFTCAKNQTNLRGSGGDHWLK